MRRSTPPEAHLKRSSSTSPMAQIEYENLKENVPPEGTPRIHRKPVPSPTVRLGESNLLHAPSSPVKIEVPALYAQHEPFQAQIEEKPPPSIPTSRSAMENISSHNLASSPGQDRLSASPQKSLASTRVGCNGSGDLSVWIQRSSSRNSNDRLEKPHRSLTPSSSMGRISPNSLDIIQQDFESHQPLQYLHRTFGSAPQSREQSRGRQMEQRYSSNSQDSVNILDQRQRTLSSAMADRRDSLRPDSALSSGSEFAIRGRGRSPVHTPDSDARAFSAHSLSASPDAKGQSYVEHLNDSYPQAPSLPAEHLDNALLRNIVGTDTSLLSTKQTIEMYRSNIKKTTDPAVQYEFAIFMIACAQEVNLDEDQDMSEDLHGTSRAELLREARHLLQKLSDRSYPFAQYYLGDGYASGLFNKGKEDYDRAFPLFVSAAKHGHAEAGYRAALCYEFGWGTKVEANKAVQFYRQTASKNHPGTMLRLGRACLTGEMGLRKTAKEGVKWLKRAAESADYQYNAAPYELGLLHETGFGNDVFRDESYTAQLFTKSAELGHAEANYRMGDAYEHGKLNRSNDPALSVHFYTGGAQLGHPLAMMALCAWYLVGAEPVLEKDEHEAFEWAKKAAEAGLPKAEYAVGYFLETGIGSRSDPLEANLWYARAAEHGDERAKHRLSAVKEVPSGIDPGKLTGRKISRGIGADGEKRKKFGIF